MAPDYKWVEHQSPNQSHTQHETTSCTIFAFQPKQIGRHNTRTTVAKSTEPPSAILAVSYPGLHPTRLPGANATSQSTHPSSFSHGFALQVASTTSISDLPHEIFDKIMDEIPTWEFADYTTADGSASCWISKPPSKYSPNMPTKSSSTAWSAKPGNSRLKQKKFFTKQSSTLFKGTQTFPMLLFHQNHAFAWPEDITDMFHMR